MSPSTRTVSFSERVPASDLRVVPLSLTLALGVSHLLLVGVALMPSLSGFLAAAVLVGALEIALIARAPFPLWMLGRIGAGGPARGLVRGVAALVLLARDGAPPTWLVLAAVGLLLVHALRVGGSALAEVCRVQRKMPILTRGLDLAPLRSPSPPPAVLARRSGEALALPDLLLVAGVSLAALGGSVVPLAVGSALAALLVLAGDLVLLGSVLAMRRFPRHRLVAAVSRALTTAAPEVALYLGSGPDMLYQIEMWVETLERLECPAVLVLRDRESLARLGPTRLPVVCVEHGSVLMSMDLPRLRLALYVSHATTNLHFLRRRGVTHAFIGHGDSDKSASTNPFLKAYDEVWVSGPAAHDRFAAAGLGLAVHRIAEVGRPQLDVVPRAEASRRGGRLTVLYAPTWEGFGDEAHQTSLASCGLELVRKLLEDGVRVLYRPHPLVGTRDPAVARTHRELASLLGDPTPAQPTGPLGLGPGDWGDLDVIGELHSASRTERVAALDDWARQELFGSHRSRHRLVPGPQFSLHVCFDAADVLLADVSSVVSDFVASAKPYGVINLAGPLPASEFAARYPSSLGGYVIGPDGHGLADLLAAGRGERDPAARNRRALRERLLGPPEPSALERMRREVDRVVSGSESPAEGLTCGTR